MQPNVKKILFVGTALLAVAAGAVWVVSTQTGRPSSATSAQRPVQETDTSSKSVQQADSGVAADQNGLDAGEAGAPPASEAPDAQEARGGADAASAQTGNENGAEGQESSGDSAR